MSELTIDQLRAKHDDSIERAELRRDGLIDRLSVWGPMMIPLIPAGLTATGIGKNYTDLLHFSPFASWPIGLVSGIGVEVFGIVANENFLDMQRYNQTLKPGEERAPEEEAKKARNTYMVIVVGLMTTLEVIPALVTVAGWPVLMATISVLVSLFPLIFLAVLAGQVIIMRKQHKARVDARREQSRKAENDGDLNKKIDDLNVSIGNLNDIIDDLQQQLESMQGVVESERDARTRAEGLARGLENKLHDIERQKAILETKVDMLQGQPTGVSEPRLAAPSPKVDADEPTISPEDRRVEVLRMLTQTSAKAEVNFAEWGRTFGTSDTTIRNDLKWLIGNGYWQNGDTWKALPKATELLGAILVAN